jgi:aryl-alcohol dehydrogenase-like predicted oxidoreductase
MGRTDIELTTLGLGTSAIGGIMGQQDDKESIAVIHEAIDLGMNWIDTARIYGDGRAEEVVARAVRQLPASKRPYVLVKGTFGHNEGHNQVRNQTRLGIRTAVDSALMRLKVDTIDLFTFHVPDFNVPIEDSWAVMAKLADEGKVRAIGLSNFDLEDLKKAEAVRHIDCIEPALSLLDRSSAGQTDVIPWCEANAVGVRPYAPLQHGLLTGAFSLERVAASKSPDSTDRRPKWGWFQEPELSRALALVEELRPIAERRGVSVGELSIAWVLAWPGVTATMVGARRRGQIVQWISAMDLQLTEQDLDDIDVALQKTKAGGVVQRANFRDIAGPDRPTRPPRRA